MQPSIAEQVARYGVENGPQPCSWEALDPGTRGMLTGQAAMFLDHALPVLIANGWEPRGRPQNESTPQAATPNDSGPQI